MLMRQLGPVLARQASTSCVDVMMTLCFSHVSFSKGWYAVVHGSGQRRPANADELDTVRFLRTRYLKRPCTPAFIEQLLSRARCPISNATRSDRIQTNTNSGEL